MIVATYELKNDDEIQIHSILRKKRRNKEVALMAIGKMMMHYALYIMILGYILLEILQCYSSTVFYLR